MSGTVIKSIIHSNRTVGWLILAPDIHGAGLKDWYYIDAPIGMTFEGCQWRIREPIN